MTPEGQVVAERPIPAEPTNCCFNDGGRSYVTCVDGSLYRAATDRRAPRVERGAGEAHG